MVGESEGYWGEGGAGGEGEGGECKGLVDGYD